MAKTIELTTIKIHSWHVDIEIQRVTVHYQLLGKDGNTHGRSKKAVFWKNIPVHRDPEGEIVPAPDTWYQLPPAYQQSLIDLTLDARSAIGARELV